MTPGDRVWYRQACRGGYGFERDVPALFERRAGRRVQIRVLLKAGTRKTIYVHPKNVRPRDKDAGVDPNLGTIDDKLED